MKGRAVSIVMFVALAFSAVSTVTARAGQGPPAGLTLTSTCSGQAGVAPGQVDVCTTVVTTGNVSPYGPMEIVVSVTSPSGVTMQSCGGGSTSGNSCRFTLLHGANPGMTVGSESFMIPFGTNGGTPIAESASTCILGCNYTPIRVTGPGAVVGGTGGTGGTGGSGGGTNPPLPTPPFLTASCVGPNPGGAVYAGQEAECTFYPFDGDIFRLGQELRVSSASPPGARTVDCSAASGPSGSTTATKLNTPDPSCQFTVASGTIQRPGAVGQETVIIPTTAAPNSELAFWVTFCTAPGSDGERACFARLQLVPDPGPGATVSLDPSISIEGAAVNSIEGADFSGPVAFMSDADPLATPAEYSASIDWGDGTQSAATLVPWAVANGRWAVIGSHAYHEEGSFPLSVSITDFDTPYNSVGFAVQSAQVSDARLSAQAQQLFSLNPFTGTVATFSDADPNGIVSDYTATIDWGDGVTSEGSVTAFGGGFAVNGTHTYAALGPYTVQAHVCDAGGACADATAPILVYGLSSGGNFVIGDGSAVVGSAAYLWGARWTTMNTLSGGVSEPSFKGFADNPNAAPALGTNWSTTPGNSAKPPDSLPSYMAVIVATGVTKDGPRIGGDTAGVVIVKTDAGYGPDPGQEGTASVVAVLPSP